jgi:penicillin amidase
MHYLRVGALLGGAAFGLLGLRRALLISPLPPRNERRILPGLDHEVEIVIDRSGVPHIRAESAHDLLFSQGYCHARDRFWQMDLNRRLARGELAEIFGRQALPADRFLRRLGFRLYAERDATAIDDEARAALEAYAAGVNAYRANHRRPIEYMLLRTEPRPWTVLDSLSFGRYMSWTQMTNWDTELTRARLIAKLGAERAAALEGGDPAPGIPRDGSEPHLDLVQAARAFAPLAGLFRGAASNNWVVAPARSESGHALLANDPHLFPRMPGVWYVAHLEGGGYDVAGATIPGLPGVIIGHNRDIAWGVTAGMVDAEDLLIERDLVGARRMSEKIVVRGGEPVTEEIVIGRHGPVISGTLDIPRDGAVLALRSVLHDFPSPTSALLRLNRASDWESFLDALRDWHFPSLNFVYADRSGTIGYKLAGQVPIRAGPAIGLPSQDLDGMQAWNGYVPFDAMPEQHDPTE